MRIGCGSFTMLLDLTLITDIHKKRSMARNVAFNMHGWYNFRGCAILSHAMVAFALIVFSSLSVTCLLVSW